jgi:hypothetical protein
MFSLGIVLAEILAGKHPFRGATPAVTASAILDRPYVGQPDATGPAADFDRIVRRMLATEPGDRFPTMADCLAELRLLEHDSGARTAVAARLPRSRRRWPIVAGIVLPWLVIGAVWLWRTSGEPANVGLPPESAPAAAAASTDASSVTFWLDVKVGPETEGVVFKSVGEQRFPKSARFRLVVKARPGVHVYVLSDDAPASDSLTLLYPRAGSAAASDGTVTTDWQAFTGPPATERVWLVSSTTPVADLDTLAATLRADDVLGTIADATSLKRVRAMLGDGRLQARAVNDIANVGTMLTGGAVLVHPLDPSHD